jgi:hypothetical protein
MEMGVWIYAQNFGDPKCIKTEVTEELGGWG